MAKDPKGTLQALASYGYKQIETFEGAQGMFWGMKPIDFKLFVNELGMEIVAGHCDVFKDFHQKVIEACAAGLQYLICPWLGPQDDLSGFKKAAGDFNQCGKICQDAGIGFAYHNHDYSFMPINGTIPMDLLMNETNPDWVSFEMDIYWVIIALHDPIKWLEKYPGRWPLVHLKDKMGIATDDKFISTVLGKGVIDYQLMLPQLKKRQVKYLMVEQERFDLADPMTAAKLNAAYMQSIC